jgi:hypothetical protein
MVQGTVHRNTEAGQIVRHVDEACPLATWFAGTCMCNIHIADHGSQHVTDGLINRSHDRAPQICVRQLVAWLRLEQVCRHLLMQL